MVCKSPTALRRAHARRPHARVYSAYDAYKRAYWERNARESIATLLSECTATPPGTCLLLLRDMSGFAGLPGASAHAERKRPRASIKDDADWKVRVTGRADDIYINGRLYTDHKGEGAGTVDGQPRRNQFTGWLITLNTNRKFSDLDEPRARYCAQYAMEGMRARFQDEFLVFGPVHPQHYGSDVPSDVIKEATYDYGIEVGHQQGRMHVHLSVTYKHLSQIQLANPLVKKEFVRLWNECAGDDFALRIKSVNFNARRTDPANIAALRIAYSQKDSLVDKNN